MLQAILLPLVTIIGFVNLLGGIVGGIWLLFKGEWGLVLIAVAFFFLGGTFLISLLLLPSIGIGFLTGALVEKKKYLVSGVLSTIAHTYTVVVMATWGLAFMAFFLLRAHPDILIPTILLSYGPATGPWGYMASKEGDFSVAHIATFFLQVAYLATGAVIIFSDPPNLYRIFGTYLGLMALGLVVCVIFSWFFLGAVAATSNTEDDAAY